MKKYHVVEAYTTLFIERFCLSKALFCFPPFWGIEFLSLMDDYCDPMLSAVLTSNYVLAKSIQKGLEFSDVKTLIYQTDYSITDRYDFMYHEGFFVHLIDPTEKHINFCLHLKNIAPGKAIVILAETENLEILDALKNATMMPVFLHPFSFKNISNIYNQAFPLNFGLCHSFMINDVSVKLDTSNRVLSFDDNSEVHLVNKEFFIMKFLLTNKGKIVSRVDLLEFVWGKSLLSPTGTIDVTMSRLRKKLKIFLKFDPIITVPCAGYILK